MRGLHRYICIPVSILILFIAVCGASCYAHDNKSYARDNRNEEKQAEISLGQIVLSENIYHVTIQMIGFNGQNSTLDTQILDIDGNVMSVASLKPAEEVKLQFDYSEELESVIITWSEEDGSLVCEPITLTFNRIYASDWQSLATATHRMEKKYSGKVQVTDDSIEYMSGRLIVKTDEELPDVSEFHVAMMVEDDDNHYFLQFEKSDEAKKCAEFLKSQPKIEYVDIDGLMTAS